MTVRQTQVDAIRQDLVAKQELDKVVLPDNGVTKFVVTQSEAMEVVRAARARNATDDEIRAAFNAEADGPGRNRSLSHWLSLLESPLMPADVRLAPLPAPTPPPTPVPKHAPHMVHNLDNAFSNIQTQSSAIGDASLTSNGGPVDGRVSFAAVSSAQDLAARGDQFDLMLAYAYGVKPPDLDNPRSAAIVSELKKDPAIQAARITFVIADPRQSVNVTLPQTPEWHPSAVEARR